MKFNDFPLYIIIYFTSERNNTLYYDIVKNLNANELSSIIIIVSLLYNVSEIIFIPTLTYIFRITI